MNIKILYIISAFILLNGCKSDINNPCNDFYDYSVNCILYNDGNAQRLYLNKTSEVGNFNRTNGYFISGANIIINGHIFNEINKDNLGNNYYEINRCSSITAGKEYNLSVIINGDTITGKTTMPGTEHILEPLNGDTIKILPNIDYYLPQMITIRWNKSADCSKYICQIVSTDSTYYNDGNNNVYLPQSRSFTLKDTVLSTDISSWKDKKSIIIRVFAYDKNYYDFYDEYKYTAGLKGAYGVFGSAVVDSVKVYFKNN